MHPYHSSAQFQPIYYLQKELPAKTQLNHAQSAKNLSLTMSIGANQNLNNLLPLNFPRAQKGQQWSSEQQLPVQGEAVDKSQPDYKNMSHQNARLREQNQFLKRQLVKLKRENVVDNSRSAQKYEKLLGGDLRGTIKREAGEGKEGKEMKEMRIKLDMLSKQCHMYEELIQKMEERIKKTAHDSSRKSVRIEELQAELGRLQGVREKVGQVTNMYGELQVKFGELQVKFGQGQIEWMRWKQSWLAEKEHYLGVIRHLENK